MKRKINSRLLGVNFTKEGTAEVWLWAPDAKQVQIHLPEKNIFISLFKEDNGYWHGATRLIQPNDLYFFLADDRQLADPASLSQPQGVHGPSQAVDLNDYNWTDLAWRNPALNHYILYELHVGTFTTAGTFKAIEEKLDYLVTLGITAIEIMPVAQFAGDRNWGYDGVFPFAVQFSYGGAHGLKHLVDACHAKGIAVILDVVYNHLGPEGNILSAFGPYFTDKYKTPWGDAINFDDAGSDEVRNYFIENVLMWFRDFHIDALRMDAVHAIKDFSPTHILKDIRLAVDTLQRATGGKHYLIVECDLNDVRFIQSVDEGGYGMDAQWVDEFHHALRVATGHEQTGYYSDFNGLAHVAKAYKDAYVYDGIYSNHRNRTFGTPVDAQVPGDKFVVFAQNHDQVGNRMLGERLSTLVSFEKQKLIAATVLLSPYLPMLFMGEEYGEQNPFMYFVSHTDEQLVEAVRKGRKREFAAFHLEGEAPDPQAPETFKHSTLQWNLYNNDSHTLLFCYYQQLIHYRKVLKPLYNLDRTRINVDLNEQKQTLIITRAYHDQQVFYAMNFSASRQDVAVPPSFTPWKKIIDSAALEWNGPESAPCTLTSSATMSLQPESVVLYSNNHV